MTDFLQVVGFDPLVITAPAGAPGTSGAPGAAGVSVVSAAINGSNHLILTMSDASTIDAGVIPGGGGAVASVNTKTGTVVLTADDIGDGITFKAYSAVDKTKLAGVATGATANSTDAVLLARANHTGTESADVLTDGTTNKAFLATERTKLAAITGTNTGDETLATIKTKLGVTTLSGSNTGDQTVTLTGDVTGSGTGSFAATLAAAGTAGTYGDATHVPQITTDSKGRVTAVTPVAITGGGGGSAVQAGGGHTGLWYATPATASLFNSVAPAVGTMHAVPLILPACTLQALAVRVLTTVAGSLIRLGIYADDGTGYPGALILDAGQVSGAVGGAISATISQAVSGLIWLASVNQTGTPACQAEADTFYSLGLANAHVVNVLAYDTKYGGYSMTGVTAALPGTFSTTVAEVTLATRVAVRIA